MSRGGKKKGEATLTQVMARLLEKELVPDLKERARMPGVEPALRQRWEKEKAARRTADAFETWVAHAAEQVGAAWILSIAFIRTLEDRGLLDRRRLAGHEAYDSEHGFFQLFPALGPRDYLLTVFRELSRLPGAEDLLGPRRNPAWRLAPSNAATQKLLDAWRKDDQARTPLWTFEGTETRFVGDLYQDLSADARERFALLQTPDFVERFILKLTLDPAVQEFGLDTVRLIDPTCGSGHFLLGAYDRLFDLRVAREPGLDRRAHALAALGQVHGIDLNPYAVAIARFRLTLAFLEKAGIGKLKDAPRLPMNLAVADSLLVAPHEQSHRLGSIAEDKAGWGFDLFDFEDEVDARRILAQGHHVVVGNPPYITCKDAVLRDEYRKLYRSCYREYALAAPFTERFFQLGVEGGFVGLINANSFMKREFGRRLIEDVLPKLDLSQVIDTSGAFIPGHGTPTVILAGRNRPALGSDVVAVLGKRGEPSTPDNAEKGLVWSTIAEHIDDVGFDNEFASVARVARATLAKHPWSLGGGGAAELKEKLDKAVEKKLQDVVADVGFGAVTREDDVYLLGHAAVRAAGIDEKHTRSLVVGESIRDWAIDGDDAAIWPYDPGSLDVATGHSAEAARNFLWPWKRQLTGRVAYGKSQIERGLEWFEYSMFFADRFRSPFTIGFAFVATHNHFVLDRGDRIFNRTAPIIKLPETASEDEHLALLGYLNSSTACFWMKQSFFDKGNRGGERGTPAESWDRFFEFDGTKLNAIPVPITSDRVVALARLLDEAGRRWGETAPERVLVPQLAPAAIAVTLDAARDARLALEGKIRWLQEELDWAIYSVFQVPTKLSQVPESLDNTPQRSRGTRPSDRLYAAQVLAGAETERFFSLCDLPPADGVARLPIDTRDSERLELIACSHDLQLIETPAYKRTFREGHRPWDPAPALRDWIRSRVEAGVSEGRAGSPQPLTRLLDEAARGMEATVLRVLGAENISDLAKIVLDAAVPHAASLRLTDAGMEKRALWERTWDLQRREDDGEKLNVPIPIPPKYDQKDYRDPVFWRLRGKLDVPKERFISYPGAERDDDKSPLIGWAGWDHLQRAHALAALYQERKEEAWTKDRLVPLLAGLLELVPWLKQWHNEPAASFGGQKLGDYFAQYVESEARENGLTLDDLRAWRPPERSKRGKR